MYKDQQQSSLKPKVENMAQFGMKDTIIENAIFMNKEVDGEVPRKRKIVFSRAANFWEPIFFVHLK